MDEISVLIVDDHGIVRQGIRAYLETQPGIRVIGEASDGPTALDMAATCRPAVVLMDLLLPGMNGIETTRALQDSSPDSQVIVLTSHHDEAQILPAIRAGALSYLLKDVAASELVAAVRRAAIGEGTLHPRAAARIVQEVRSPAAATTDPRADLSDRELEVLRLVAQGHTNAEIAGVLIISEKTVKSHVSNILSKLHLADRTQAAAYAWRNRLVDS